MPAPLWRGGAARSRISSAGRSARSSPPSPRAGSPGGRPGLVEPPVERTPPWLALAAVLAGGYPIFLNVVRALRNRAVTSHALMTLGILGAIAIGQYAAAAAIVV